MGHLLSQCSGSLQWHLPFRRAGHGKPLTAWKTGPGSQGVVLSHGTGAVGLARLLSLNPGSGLASLSQGMPLGK